MEVGVRELKAKLSEYVSRAAAGESVVVTDRGRPVARLTSIDSDATLNRGFDEGWIEPPKRSGLAPYERQSGHRPVLDALDEDRRS